MNTAIKAASRKLIGSIDWKLLLFLLLFLDVKLVVKLIAIVFIYIARPHFSFGFKIMNSKLPLFYPTIILIAFLNFFLYKGYTNSHYVIAFLVGLFFWILCILAVSQIRLAVERNKPEVVHNTLLVFFITNCIASFARLLIIIIDAGTLNPYRYQGMYQKYFIGTGDLIRGITFDTSTTNAVICAAGVVYFLCRKHAVTALLCMATLLLTGSNFTNLILMTTLLYLFIFQSDRVQKSLMIACGMFLIVFMAKVSPQNDTYATGIIKHLFIPQNHQLAATHSSNQIVADPTSEDEKKKLFAKNYMDSISNLLAAIRLQKQAQMEKRPGQIIPALASVQQRPEIPEPSIHSKPFQRRKDTLQEQRILLNYVNDTRLEKRFDDSSLEKYPGKMMSFLQTFQFFHQHPSKLITGNGTGNFSSKLAFRTTALNISGGYPLNYAYINEDFKNNHLKTFLHFFSKDAELHSVVNTPNSVYNQLAGEYGLAGLLAFLLGYLFFWGRHFKKFRFGTPLLLLMCAAFFMDYWFEQLSIIILFELLLFLDIKDVEQQQQNKDPIAWKKQVLQY